MTESASRQILIQQARIIEGKDTTRLVHKLVENGKDIELFFEVEKQYSQYLCTELADGILLLLLPIAMTHGYDIISEIPVTEEFLHHIRKVKIPALLGGTPSLASIQIKAPASNLRFNGNAIGTSASGGVDCLYTIKEYTAEKYNSLRISHLFIASCSLDLEIGECSSLAEWERKYSQHFERFNGIAKDISLPLIKAFSNYYDYIVKDHRRKLTHLGTFSYINMANVLALKKLWRGYHLPSGLKWPSFDAEEAYTNKPCTSYALLDTYSLSIPGFTLINSGAEHTKVGKIIKLLDFPLAHKYMHTCLTRKMKINCTTPICGKCLLTLLTLDCYDKLEKFSSVYDIEYYQKHHKDFLEAAIRNQNMENIKSIFPLLLEKYPHEMELAAYSHEKNQWLSNYTCNEKAYDLTIKFLSLKQLKLRIQRYIAQGGGGIVKSNDNWWQQTWRFSSDEICRFHSPC